MGKLKKCTFIGYGVNDFGYRLYDYKNHKIIRRRDVIFKRSCIRISCKKRNRKKKSKEYAVLDEITEKAKVPENNNNQQPQQQ